MMYMRQRETSAPARVPFVKMNGAGNDFVVLDSRAYPLELSPEQVRRLADRGNSATQGCDQVIVLEHSPEKADVFMRIFNADGSEVSACGNATRCVGALVMEQTGKNEMRIQTRAGLLACTRAEGGITADMGRPCFDPAGIPLAAGMSADPVPVAYNGLKDGIALSVGNPHVVYFVKDVSAVDLATYGPRIERRTDVFPQRVNVSVARVRDPEHIVLRVWERGAGLTLACGTAACAVLAAAASRGLSSRAAEIVMLGGAVQVEWRDDDHLWMTGPAVMEFTGLAMV